MAFLTPGGTQKKRPGVYLRIVNRGAGDETPQVTPTPEESDGLMVSYGGSVVTLTLPGGSTVSVADGIVTIAALPEAVSYAGGIVTIGG